MATKSFLGIQFWNNSTQELLQVVDGTGGLFTVPSAPSLAMMRNDPLLTKAYQSSDWAVVDGGYVALVLRMCFGRNLPRISGLQILQRLVGEKEKRAIPFHERNTLWVVPSQEEKERIDYFLEDSGFSHTKRHWYFAPFYKTDADFQDEELEKIVDDVKPDWIILCIGGGKQEKLGYYLRNANIEKMAAATNNNATPRPKGPVILCTGGAIAFLTGGQANIPTWADRLYLGWLFRVLQSPRTFLPRYWNAGYEFPRLLWEWRGSLFQ